MTRRFAFRLLAACAASVALVSCNDSTAPEPTFNAVPTPINGNKTFVDLSLGDFHSCGLQANGEAFCWGTNSQGQSGNGVSPDGSVITPLVVLGGFLFNSLSAGGSHTCGIQTSGVSVCWGNNAGGQLGVGNTVDRVEPTPVSGSHPFVQLSSSTFAHTCGRTADGEAWCWGINEFGRLGDGTSTNRNAPVQVSGSLAFTTITSGGGHSCGLTSDGTAYCWGLNERGQLGDGTTTNRLVPVTVATTVKFTSIAAGLSHTCALRADGTPYCWGDNVAGALGDGSVESKSAPVQLEGGAAFTTIVMGERHGCGLTPDSLVMCWGYNVFGSVGDGTQLPVRTQPVLVNTPVLFKKIAAGAYHTCGISTQNVTYCWGDNSLLQLGSETP